MKKQSRALLAVMLVLLLAVLTCCSSNNPLTGRWELVDINDSGSLAGIDAEALAFLKALGGTIEMEFTGSQLVLSTNMMGESNRQSMECSVKGSHIALSTGEKLDYTLRDDQLTLSMDGSSLILNRIGK